MEVLRKHQNANPEKTNYQIKYQMCYYFCKQILLLDHQNGILLQTTAQYVLEKQFWVKKLPKVRISQIQCRFIVHCEKNPNGNFYLIFLALIKYFLLFLYTYHSPIITIIKIYFHSTVLFVWNNFTTNFLFYFLEHSAVCSVDCLTLIFKSQCRWRCHCRCQKSLENHQTR